MIRSILSPGLHTEELLLGPGDDAAVLRDGWVLGMDSMSEGVHWDERCSPEDVGWKLVAVNASDISACGARARWALLSLSLPSRARGDWLEGFREGLHRGLRWSGMDLIGGDTSGSIGPVSLCLTAMGRLRAPVLTRAGGQPGDELWVSGQLGSAALGFYSPDPSREQHQAWSRPLPPLALGPALAEAGLASAAMDLSDGLAKDLRRLCRASGCGALVELSALPLDPELPPESRVSWGLGFGEDYQLLFTAPERLHREVCSLGDELELELSCVGRLQSDPDLILRGGAWPQGWDHFARESA